MEILRTCIATREKYNKKDLIRVVKVGSEIKIDLSQSVQGRGAYILKTKEAILLAQKKKALSKALRTNVSDDIYSQLLIIIEGSNY